MEIVTKDNQAKQLTISDFLVDHLKNIIDGTPKKDVEGTPFDSRKVFLFFSVDLVNSTLFKAENPNWVPVVRDFYEMVRKHVVERDFGSIIQVWKYSGDEVLFYSHVENVESIIKAPSHLHEAMQMALSELYDIHKEARNFLYMKGAVWMAIASENNILREFGRSGVVTNDSGENILMPQNIYFELPNCGKLDFVGTEIDEGFRMCGNAVRGKVVIDPKIAYMLANNRDLWKELVKNEVEETVRIVGYDRLKGIWKGRMYPVIWYTKNWNKSFLYDEWDANKFVKSAYDGDYTKIEFINKIFEDLGLSEGTVKYVKELL